MRLAFRSLACAKGFTLAAVLILALGSVASTESFGVVGEAPFPPLANPGQRRLICGRVLHSSVDEMVVRRGSAPLRRIAGLFDRLASSATLHRARAEFETLVIDTALLL